MFLYVSLETESITDAILQVYQSDKCFLGCLQCQNIDGSPRASILLWLF